VRPDPLETPGRGVRLHERGNRGADVLEMLNEATRLFLQNHLIATADRHGEHVQVDGVIHHRHEPDTPWYFTLCDALDLKRWTYCEIGVRNGPTANPHPR